MDTLSATFVLAGAFAILGAVFGLMAFVADELLTPWIRRRQLEREYDETCRRC